MRLNLGCGEFYADGWTNVDWMAPTKRDLTVDLRGPLPFTPGSVQRIYCGHILEHLTFQDAGLLLSRLLQVAAAGCLIMVVGPDVDRAAEMCRRNLIDEMCRLSCHTGGPANGVDHPGALHQWDCTGPLCVQSLKDAGWVRVEEIPIERVPREWPVVSNIGWQCAVSAAASGF